MSLASASTPISAPSTLRRFVSRVKQTVTPSTAKSIAAQSRTARREVPVAAAPTIRLPDAAGALPVGRREMNEASPGAKLAVLANVGEANDAARAQLATDYGDAAMYALHSFYAQHVTGQARSNEAAAPFSRSLAKIDAAADTKLDVALKTAIADARRPIEMEACDINDPVAFKNAAAKAARRPGGIPVASLASLEDARHILAGGGAWKERLTEAVLLKTGALRVTLAPEDLKRAHAAADADIQEFVLAAYVNDVKTKWGPEDATESADPWAKLPNELPLTEVNVVHQEVKTHIDRVIAKAVKAARTLGVTAAYHETAAREAYEAYRLSGGTDAFEESREDTASNAYQAFHEKHPLSGFAQTLYPATTGVSAARSIQNVEYAIFNQAYRVALDTTKLPAESRAENRADRKEPRALRAAMQFSGAIPAEPGDASDVPFVIPAALRDASDGPPAATAAQATLAKYVAARVVMQLHAKREAYGLDRTLTGRIRDFITPPERVVMQLQSDRETYGFARTAVGFMRDSITPPRKRAITPQAEPAAIPPQLQHVDRIIKGVVGEILTPAHVSAEARDETPIPGTAVSGRDFATFTKQTLDQHKTLSEAHNPLLTTATLSTEKVDRKIQKYGPVVLSAINKLAVAPDTATRVTVEKYVRAQASRTYLVSDHAVDERTKKLGMLFDNKPVEGRPGDLHAYSEPIAAALKSGSAKIARLATADVKKFDREKHPLQSPVINPAVRENHIRTKGEQSLLEVLINVPEEANRRYDHVVEQIRQAPAKPSRIRRILSVLPFTAWRRDRAPAASR